MNTIVQDTVAFAPSNLNKVQLAKWIKAKWKNIDWESAHYHAMHAVLTRVECRIREMFVHLIGEEPDEFAIRQLFDRSLSERYDYVCDWVNVPKCDQEFEELVFSDLP